MSAHSGPSLDLQFNYSFWHLTHSLHWLCGKLGKEWRSWYEKKIRKSERRGKSVQERKQSSLRRKREESRRKEGNNILLECACLFLLSPSFHSKHHLWSPYPNHLIFLHSAMTSLDKLLCYQHGTSDKPFGLVTEVWNTPPTHTHTPKRQSPAEKEAFPPAWSCEKHQSFWFKRRVLQSCSSVYLLHIPHFNSCVIGRNKSPPHPLMTRYSLQLQWPLLQVLPSLNIGQGRVR